MERITMEEFGPISVDHYTGQRVAKVGGDGATADDYAWYIEFETGVRIYNYDHRLKQPKAIVGARLTKLILAGRPGGDPRAQLFFGLEEVRLNPIHYGIHDPQRTGGKVVMAQQSNANIGSVPPPPEPEDRMAEGPDAAWEGEQQRLRDAAIKQSEELEEEARRREEDDDGES